MSLGNDSLQSAFCFSVSVLSICSSALFSRSTCPLPCRWFGVVWEPITPQFFLAVQTIDSQIHLPGTVFLEGTQTSVHNHWIFYQRQSWQIFMLWGRLVHNVCNDLLLTICIHIRLGTYPDAGSQWIQAWMSEWWQSVRVELWILYRAFSVSGMYSFVWHSALFLAACLANRSGPGWAMLCVPRLDVQSHCGAVSKLLICIFQVEQVEFWLQSFVEVFHLHQR